MQCRAWVVVPAVAAVWSVAGTRATARGGEPVTTTTTTTTTTTRPSAPEPTGPLRLMLQSDYDTVYAPPEPPREEEGVNEGGVHHDLTVSYFTDYVFRGLDWGERITSAPSTDADPPREEALFGHEDSPNLQFDGRIEFDLGRAPHPFVGVFVNTYDADPESQFQEIRPYFGLSLRARPITFSAGHTSFIYPDRDSLNTTEVWGRLALDDSYFLRGDDPLFSPYVMAAYDYDLYEGLYLEGGVEHDFTFEDWGIVLTAQASVAYVSSHEQFTPSLFAGSPIPGADNTGFQHYQLGLVGSYDLNPLLGIPKRYGQWTLQGYMFYTDGIDDQLEADTQMYGGAGIGFRY
jgi:hypothetical protein